MSLLYDLYIKEHKENVHKCFEWLVENVPDIFKNENDLNECRHQCIYEHDQSKHSVDEYDAYDAYFYGGNRSSAVVNDFNLAWLHHIHNNPHHWQYWVLVNDDPQNGEIILDMPDNYIVEMVCDWWSFSWKSGDLYEITSWYDNHKNYMKLSDNTRKKVEDILHKIVSKLNKLSQEDDTND